MTDSPLLILALLVLLALSLLLLAGRRWQTALRDLEERYRESQRQLEAVQQELQRTIQDMSLLRGLARCLCWCGSGCELTDDESVAKISINVQE